MAGDTPPHFYIAEDFLIPPAHPDAGVAPVAAYAPGDLVHPADVDAYGWHDKVTRPGTAPDGPGPADAPEPGENTETPTAPEQEPPAPAPAATPGTTDEE